MILSTFLSDISTVMDIKPSMMGVNFMNIYNLLIPQKGNVIKLVSVCGQWGLCVNHNSIADTQASLVSHKTPV